MVIAFLIDFLSKNQKMVEDSCPKNSQKKTMCLPKLCYQISMICQTFLANLIIFKIFGWQIFIANLNFNLANHHFNLANHILKLANHILNLANHHVTKYFVLASERKSKCNKTIPIFFSV